MKKKLNIVGNFLGIIGAMLLIYNSASGIINSANHGTKNIFGIIVLPFSILLLLFCVIMLIQSLRNIAFNKFVFVFANTIAFTLGLLFFWFAIVKSDNNLFYIITGCVTTISAVLMINK